MRRREFIAGVGAAAAWPALVNALDAASPIVGFLTGGLSYKEPVMQPYWAAFQDGRTCIAGLRRGTKSKDRASRGGRPVRTTA